MTTTTKTKAEFKPTAALITEAAEFQDAGQTRVDPALVTLLHLDSVNNCGWLYTREEWEGDKEARIYRRFGEHEGLQEGERVELLPDVWIVKIDEREHWIAPDILDKTARIFGVYVFDRRQVTHCCSLSGSYYLTFLGTQWEESRELTDDEREELDESIREGNCQCESSNYFDERAVDRMIAESCREGCLPTGKAGGFHVDVTAVVTDDAIAEIEEAYRGSEL
jgi:hypothetical protein